MTYSLRFTGGDDFARLGRAMSKAGPELADRITANLRTVAQRVGRAMRDEAAGQMPQKGGLGNAVGRSTVVVDAKSFRGSPRVEVGLDQPDGYHLEYLNAGVDTHPVFGRRDVIWPREPVKPDAFTAAAKKREPDVAVAVKKAVDTVIADIANQ